MRGARRAAVARIMKGSELRQNSQCTACRSVISRPRSPVCRSSPASTSTTTRRARRCTSARRACCATGSAATSARYGMSPRIDALLDEAQRLEVIVTDSVVEALALENHLIKQRAAEYNILLRDDKNYPYLQLTTGEAFPRVLVARRVERDEHFYAGPFMPASLGAQDDVADAPAVRHPVVQRDHHRRARPRPCLEFDIKRCIAPCVREICSRERIPASPSSTRSCSSKGGTTSWSATLRDRMTRGRGRGALRAGGAAARRASGPSRRCAPASRRWRAPELGDRDAFGLKLGPAGAVVQVFQMRARPGGRADRARSIRTLGRLASIAGRPARRAEGGRRGRD